MEDHRLPAFNYYLDESDPDVLILRVQDGSFVAAFSASGATKEGILEAAKEDYWERVRAHAARQEKASKASGAPRAVVTENGPPLRCLLSSIVWGLRND